GQGPRVDRPVHREEDGLDRGQALGPNGVTVGVEIRRATLADAGQVRELRLRALESDPDAFGETLERARTRPEADYVDWIGSRENGMFVAADADGSLVGMAVGGPA